MQNFVESGRTIAWCTRRGRVAGVQARGDTYVEGGGGGPHHVNVSIRSRVVVQQQFHLVPDDGGVHLPVQLTGLDLPIMDGQDVTLFAAGPAGADRLDFVRLVNHDTRQPHRLVHSGTLCNRWKLLPFSSWWALAPWFVGMLLPIDGAGWLGFLLMIGLAVWLQLLHSAAIRRLDRRFDAAADSLLAGGSPRPDLVPSGALPLAGA